VRYGAALRALAAALALCAATSAAGNDAELRAGTFDPPRAAPERALAGSDGQPLTLARVRGKVVVLAFGFTHCTNVCPVTLATLARARRALGAAASDVQVVYVTVDSERDDAKRMHDVLAAYDPSFVGGTGDEARLAAARTAYGVSSRRLDLASGVAYDHSSFAILIDRAGKLRGIAPFRTSADDYVHDFRVLLGS
jgi:protein SCO1/2